MAANVDSPKRQSLRLQNARVDSDSGAAATSSGVRGPAKPRTSGTAKRLSAEKRRVDTGGQERSLGKRRSTESPHKENESDKGPNDTAPTTGRNKKRDFTESAHPMEPKGAHPMEPNTKTVDTTHSPGGEHSRNIRPRRNRDSSSLHVADSTREGSSCTTDDNTSISRDTRSSKSKNHEVPVSSTAVRGLGEGAISSKEKNDNAHLSEPNFGKDQGSEGPGESSSLDRSLQPRRSLRPRRSDDDSIANRGNTPRGAAGTNTPCQRQARSSGGKDLEGSGASTAIRGKGAISNKKKTKNVHLAEPNSQKEGGVEDPGGSNSDDSSLQLKSNHEGSSFNVEDSSFSSTPTLNGKTRASGAKDLGEHAVGRQGESVVSSKQKNDNPELAETNSQQGEGSEDPGGSSSHIISLQPRRNINGTKINVEDSPRGAGLSTGANASFSRETRSSKAKNYEEPGASTAVIGLGESAGSRKEMKDNAHPTEPNSQEEKGSGGRVGSNSHNRSLQQLKSHEGPSINVEDFPRGSSSPTKSHDLTSEEARSSKQKDCKDAGVSTAAKGMDSNALVRKEEQVIRRSNQNERVVDISGGVSSPGKNLRPRRSNDGSGISSGKSVTVKGSDGKKEKRGEAEPIIQSAEVSHDPGGSISPRKTRKTNPNLEDPVDDRRQPSNVTTESNAGEATRDYKVQCCSKQLLQEVLGMCTGICKEMLDSQQYLNEEQKQQHHKNFAWNFETAFQENVSVNGLSWHEAPDEDSEPDIKILEDQLDEVMVKTSMKRKRYPRKILSHFVKALKTEREILNQYKPAVNPRKVALDPAFEFRMKDLSATAATVCQHIHETKKALPIQLEKAEGFSQVLNLQPLLAESRIRKDIFYSRVVLEDISKSIPKVLETTLPESEPKALATPVRSLRKRRISLPQRHLYPIRSKRKISLES